MTNTQNFKGWNAVDNAIERHYNGNPKEGQFEADQIRYRAELKAALEEKKVREHHCSWASGYVSRKNPEGFVFPYKGKFGEGYVAYTPSWKSSDYCACTYYVLEKYFN